MMTTSTAKHKVFLPPMRPPEWGIYTRVAAGLGVDKSTVSLIARGRRSSRTPLGRRVVRALRTELKRRGIRP